MAPYINVTVKSRVKVRVKVRVRGRVRGRGRGRVRSRRRVRKTRNPRLFGRARELVAAYLTEV